MPFDEYARREIERVAKDRGWPAAALLAIVEVESGGRTHAVVNGRPEPLIRFEGHYFDRRLPSEKQAVARREGLASPSAGAVKNPPGQAARWRMLARAAAIDKQAAYESVSWGLGQVMGAHWEWLGYHSVEDLVKDARNGVYGQVRLMANYIEKAGLADALKRQDWHTFAGGYNGPGYARNGYHTKMAAAYERWSKAKPLPSVPTPTPRPDPSRAPKPAPAAPQPSKAGILAAILAALAAAGAWIVNLPCNLIGIFCGG